MTTRITAASAERQDSLDAEAVAVDRAGARRAAEEGDALAHAGDPVAAGGQLGGRAAAVVLDGDGHRRRAVGDRDRRVCRARVAHDVRQRLLDDAVRRQVEGRGQRPWLAPHVQHDMESGVSCLAQEGVEAPRARAAATRSGRSSPGRRSSSVRCISLIASRPRSAIAASERRVRSSPAPPAVASAACACTTIRLTLWATTSWSSRAIRTRSSATARSASNSRIALGAPGAVVELAHVRGTRGRVEAGDHRGGRGGARRQPRERREVVAPDDPVRPERQHGGDPRRHANAPRPAARDGEEGDEGGQDERRRPRRQDPGDEHDAEHPDGRAPPEGDRRRHGGGAGEPEGYRRVGATGVPTAATAVSPNNAVASRRSTA